MAITITTIVDCAWSAFIETITKNMPFASGRLNDAWAEGQICLVDDWSTLPPPATQMTSQVINSCMGWSSQEEIKWVTENQKINFVKNMFHEVVRAHDKLLLERIDQGKHLFVSAHYKYKLSAHEVPIPNAKEYVLRTLIAESLKDVLLTALLGAAKAPIFALDKQPNP